MGESHSYHCTMKTKLFHLGFCLLVSAQGSYVTQQKICKQIPREICTESRVPVTKHLTEQKCSTIPTSRQECNLQQEKECYQVPEMKCFDEPGTGPWGRPAIYTVTGCTTCCATT